jgi:hypothetical protein
MPTTFIDLTNKLLRRINDVEIRIPDFASVRGVQAAAKDAINDTITEINATKLDWPFNAQVATQVLTPGVEVYDWPNEFNSVDWNSFQIQKDPALNIESRSLNYISREQWFERLRNEDDDAGTSGRIVPVYCFPAHGDKFGVSPSPNQAFTLKYNYYSVPIALDAYDDQTSIPSKFDYVIIAGGLYYMNLFKENPDGNAIMKAKFLEGVKDMLNTFYPNPRFVYDGRVNFGGGSQNTSGYLWYKG